MSDVILGLLKAIVPSLIIIGLFFLFTRKDK